jgi:hypothetical protein
MTCLSVLLDCILEASEKFLQVHNNAPVPVPATHSGSTHLWS